MRGFTKKGVIKLKISKGTILRAVFTALVVINLILKNLGLDVLGTEDTTAAALAEAISEASVILISFWKNNSFTQNAIKADEYLKELKNN